MPATVELADKYGVKYDADNPVPVAATIDTSAIALEATQQDVLAALTDTSTINVAQDTAVIKNGSADLTPKYADIAASSSGDNEIVALVASKKIRVLAYNFMGNGAVNAKWQSSGTGDLTGLKYIASAGQGICAPFNPVGWFETAAGEALQLNLSGAVAVGGELVYVEV